MIPPCQRAGEIQKPLIPSQVLAASVVPCHEIRRSPEMNPPLTAQHCLNTAAQILDHAQRKAASISADPGTGSHKAAESFITRSAALATAWARCAEAAAYAAAMENLSRSGPLTAREIREQQMTVLLTREQAQNLSHLYAPGTWERGDPDSLDDRTP